ncbi:unnamed protein product, partial [Staurois parvus]
CLIPTCDCSLPTLACSRLRFCLIPTCDCSLPTLACSRLRFCLIPTCDCSLPTLACLLTTLPFDPYLFIRYWTSTCLPPDSAPWVIPR